MAGRICGLIVGLLGLAGLASGPFLVHGALTTTNREDPSAGGVLVFGAFAIIAGLVFVVAGISVYRGRSFLGFRLPEPKDLF